jgi:cytochrome c
LGLTCSATAQDSDQSNVVADIGDVGALYSAEGAGVTYDYCASCHSTMLIAQQGQTREGWDELFEWMVEKQGMEPIPEEDRTKILDYLETHYNTDRPHFP